MKLAWLLLIAWGATAQTQAQPEYDRGPGTGRDDECLVCHAGVGEEEAPKVDLQTYRASSHAQEGCIGCHPGVEDEDIRHEEKDEDLPPPDCTTCHEKAEQATATSVHTDPSAIEEGSERKLPDCADCHGRHDIFPSEDFRARVHPIHQLESCGQCHSVSRDGGGHRFEPPREYRELIESNDQVELQRLFDEGKLISAGCTDCHGAHDANPATVQASPLHPSHTVDTCGTCHQDQAKAFRGSIHDEASEKEGFQWRADPPADEPQPPVCGTCHRVHEQEQPNPDRPLEGSDLVRMNVVHECGHCHEPLYETYLESYHGKATALGDASVAKCSDCHGFHDVLSPENEASSVADGNKLATCSQDGCHPGAPEGFAGFWPHADPTDSENYFGLYVVYTFMMTLLLSVFAFWGLHTLLFAARETVDAFREGPLPKSKHTGKEVRRFSTLDRLLHLAVIISFLGLAATGAPLKFATTEWAQIFFNWIGGVKVAGTLHRIFGVITFGYFIVHLGQLAAKLWPYMKDGTIIKVLLGPDSLVPSLSDFTDLFKHMGYFLGLREKPTWDRWTYWEKFDYWAVFWGVAIIGSSGLVLWFPTFFTLILPGWVVNIALVVHSDEALLAMGFIFGVHFFNGHLRRSKFPMDKVMFTGTVPVEEFTEERGREWARLEAEEREQLQTPPPSRWLVVSSYLFGIAAWLFGLTILGFIVHGFFFAHH